MPGTTDSGVPATAELDSAQALIGSNGDVTIGGGADTIKIYGDVVPGVDGEVVVGTGGSVTGTTNARLNPVELPDVELPDIARGSAVVHDSAYPMIISPGSVGFDGIEVAPDAELIVRGPATVLVGDLSLAAGAALTLDTTDGDVELFVTNTLHIEPDSTVFTPAHQPGKLTVQVSADDRMSAESAVHLQARGQFYGTVYAPDAKVVVGGEFELFGSVAARVLDLEPGARLHYDEAAADNMPRIVSWNIVEVPAQIHANLANVVRTLGIEASAQPALSDAHDLGGIELAIRYTDLAGAEQTYSGAEAGFDWNLVAEVTDSSRTGWDDWASGWYNDWWEDWGAAWWEVYANDWATAWGANWGNTATTGSTQDDQGTGGVDLNVQDMIDRRTGMGMPNGGLVFVDKLVADHLPLSTEEWSAIYAIPEQPDNFNMTRLKDADLAAGGTGG